MGKTNLTLKILLIFTLYLISVGGAASSEVTGYSGGGVLIKCKYHTDYTSNKKYFCKGSWPNCADLIKTGDKNNWVNTGRFSLIDYTSSAEFWVMIRKLTVKDSGTYQCAVDKLFQGDIYTPAILKISEDKDYEKSISLKGHVGQTVNFSCNYPQSLSTKPKFLCRRERTTDCYYTTSVKENKKWIKEGRFSLYDDRASKTFTVRISSVTEGDSGEYWCGAESDWESDHGYKIYFTQINLRVTDNKTSTTAPTSMVSSTSAPSRNQSRTESIDFIYITVGLVVMVIVLLLALIALYRFNKKPETSKVPVEMTPLNTVPSSPEENKPNEVPTTDDCIYQEIDKPQPEPAKPSTVNTIYSTAEEPTDSSIYSTIDEPPTLTVYSAVTLPQQNPTNSPSPQDEYSTVTLPQQNPTNSTIPQ